MAVKERSRQLADAVPIACPAKSAPGARSLSWRMGRRRYDGMASLLDFLDGDPENVAPV